MGLALALPRALRRKADLESKAKLLDERESKQRFELLALASTLEVQRPVRTLQPQHQPLAGSALELQRQAPTIQPLHQPLVDSALAEVQALERPVPKPLLQLNSGLEEDLALDQLPLQRQVWRMPPQRPRLDSTLEEPSFRHQAPRLQLLRQPLGSPD